MSFLIHPRNPIIQISKEFKFPSSGCRRCVFCSLSTRFAPMESGDRHSQQAAVFNVWNGKCNITLLNATKATDDNYVCICCCHVHIIVTHSMYSTLSYTIAPQKKYTATHEDDHHHHHPIKCPQLIKRADTIWGNLHSHSTIQIAVAFCLSKKPPHLLVTHRATFIPITALCFEQI